MRVLVTGSGGVLGRHIVAELAENGHAVRAHDRVPLPPRVAERAGEVVTGDLCDGPGAAGLLAGVDAVVHAAAYPTPHAAPEPDVFTNNVQAAFNVLDTAGRAGVGRIVYVSSLSALGIAWSRWELSPLSVPIADGHPYIGDDVYGLSKHVGEHIAATVGRHRRAAAISLRFPFLGTGERLRRHLARVHADPGVDRKGLWAWLDVRDAARAVAAALTGPVEGHTIVNVCAPDTTALVPTAQLLRRYHPRVPVTEPLEGFATPYATRRAAELLGFSPIHTWRTEDA